MQLDDGASRRTASNPLFGSLEGSFDWNWDAADRAFGPGHRSSIPVQLCAWRRIAAYFCAFLRRGTKASPKSPELSHWIAVSVHAAEIDVYSQLRRFLPPDSSQKKGLILDTKDSSQHSCCSARVGGSGSSSGSNRGISKAMETSDDPRPASTALAPCTRRTTGAKGGPEEILTQLIPSTNPKAMAPLRTRWRRFTPGSAGQSPSAASISKKASARGCARDAQQDQV